MAVNLSFIGGAGWQFFDNNGIPLAGGKVYTYAAGTTVPLATYTARDGLTANTNPIILDSAGRTPAQIWSTEGLLYKYVVATSTDVVLRTWDNIGGSVVASNLAQDLANTTDNSKGDALVGFKQSNSTGFLTGATARTVSAKLSEIVSVKDFGAVGNGVADDTAAIQAAVTASEAVYFPDGETFRVTAEIIVPADRRLFGGGEIFVDQSPYVRAIRMGSNGLVDGLKFRGNGVATDLNAGLLGGQRGLAVASFGTNNVKVKNCQFYDFVSTGLNTGGAVIQFSNGYAFEVSGCYFDTSNDGFADIDASYTAGDTIITKNVSYSNSDFFFGCASVGSATKVGTSDVSVTSHHIVTDNIAIKNHWAPAPAGRDLGRHGIAAHYDDGLSYLTASNNIIGNVSRHGIYLRGPSTVVTNLCGPNLVSNNYLLYCGSGELSNYCSGIRAENTLPTTITGNYLENSGYFPDGSNGTSLAYDIECVRGVTDLIISDNVCLNAKDGGIYLATNVGDRRLANIFITENTIKNAAFGVSLLPGLTTSSVKDVKILSNYIELTGATYDGNRAAGIWGEINASANIDMFSLQVIGNTIAGTGKLNNQYGIAFQFGTETFSGTALIADNILRDLQFGLASKRFAADTFSYIPHRRLGTILKWVRNRFVSCEEALVVPKTTLTILAVVEEDNIYEDCTTPHVAQTIGNDTAVEGQSIGRDASGNLLVEFKASAVPVLQQYYQGDRITHTAPAAGGNFGWICVASGTPGTWKTYGGIAP